MSPFNRHIDLGSKQLNVRRMMGFRLLIPSHSALPDLKSVLSILTGIEEFGSTSAKPFCDSGAECTTEAGQDSRQGVLVA